MELLQLLDHICMSAAIECCNLCSSLLLQIKAQLLMTLSERLRAILALYFMGWLAKTKRAELIKGWRRLLCSNLEEVGAKTNFLNTLSKMK